MQQKSHRAHQATIAHHGEHKELCGTRVWKADTERCHFSFPLHLPGPQPQPSVRTVNECWGNSAVHRHKLTPTSAGENNKALWHWSDSSWNKVWARLNTVGIASAAWVRVTEEMLSVFTASSICKKTATACICSYTGEQQCVLFLVTQVLSYKIVPLSEKEREKKASSPFQSPGE